jgi:hypothetical protein
MTLAEEAKVTFEKAIDRAYAYTLGFRAMQAYGTLAQALVQGAKAGVTLDQSTLAKAERILELAQDTWPSSFHGYDGKGIDRTFVKDWLDGIVTPADIRRYASSWHRGDGAYRLHEYLGFTPDEFERWTKNPDCLPEILEIYRIQAA